MDNKRNSLKKLAGISTTTVMLPHIWVKPVVDSILLPVHAQTSPEACAGPPIVEVVSPALCSGTSTGNGIIGIRSFDENEQSLKAVNISTSDSDSDLSDFPISLPFLLEANVGVLLNWTGPANATGSCFPLADISLELEYCCSDGVSVFETYDITQLFVDAAV